MKLCLLVLERTGIFLLVFFFADSFVFGTVFWFSCAVWEQKLRVRGRNGMSQLDADGGWGKADLLSAVGNASGVEPERIKRKLSHLSFFFLEYRSDLLVLCFHVRRGGVVDDGWFCFLSWV